jgi:dihydroneopterin aldolase
MNVEVHGLELHGRHGVHEEERRDGQAFLVDVTLRVPEPARDDLDATIDYRRVRDVVRAVNERDSFLLLEAFAAAIADALESELQAEHVAVRVRKPGIAWAEWAAASVERP